MAIRISEKIILVLKKIDFHSPHFPNDILPSLSQLEKPQTTQTQPDGCAARRSRSFHSRAAPAAALELLLGNLNNQLNQLKSQISDHKAAAGAVRRRRKRLVAAGCKPASAWSAFFSKGVQSRKKTSIIYPLDYYFYNTFNPLENIYSYCIRNKHTYQTSQKTEQSTPKSRKYAL